MIFYLIVCVIFALLILLLFVLLNINWDKRFTVIKYIDDCENPTILGLTKRGLYTNVISNPDDKILILFISNDEINGTFISNKDYQLINKEKVNRVVLNDYNEDLLLFAFNYRIYFSSPYRITSIQTQYTYKTNKNQMSFFSNDLGYFMISSLNPLKIDKINDTNFNIIEEYMNVSWINNYGFINIKSNPILINGIYWMIGCNEDKLIFILFDFIKKEIINHYQISVDFEIHNGLIYNKYKDMFLIPIKKNGKISIFNIKRNFLD